MKPKIGLTTSYHHPSLSFNSFNYKSYIEALTGSGADVFMILPEPRHDFSFLSHLDGILLSGGGDIPPHFWGEKSDMPFEIKDKIRSSFEIDLLHKVFETKMPIFGICLGLQTINVAFGGTLWTDFPDPKSKVLHCRKPDGLSSYHPISLARNSHLSEIIGKTATVNSRHHEAVKNIAPGFLPTSTANDGTIESIECIEKPWIFGVQWHPEDLMTDSYQQKLFKHFISLCSK